MNAPLITPVSDLRHAEALAALCGGAVTVDSYGPQVESPEGLGIDADTVRAGWVAPIADLGVLHVDGEDSVRFLHSQLTNDLEALAAGAWQLSGYCSAKGRLLASLMVFRSDDGIRLIASQPLIAGLRKRLSMFVLRAKVRMTDETDRWFLFGVGGVRAPQALTALGAAWPEPEQRVVFGGSAALGCRPVPAPGTGLATASLPSIARALLLVPVSEADSVWALLRERLAVGSSVLWRWTEVKAGVPRIVPAALERFVPQMVNLDLVDGVSFRKGCYPGQEIVARSHYLGKLKRRMFLAQVDHAPPAAGTDVLPADSADPCGEVVMAAPSPGGGSHLLFESQISSARDARLADGRSLRLLDLPYPLERG